MKGKTLYRVTDNEGDTFLSDRKWTKKGDGIKDCVPVQWFDVTKEDLVELLDAEAEDANYHDFVGVHLPLASIIIESGGNEDIAKQTLYAIAINGGIISLRH